MGLQMEMFGEGNKPTKEAVIITKEDLEGLSPKELTAKFIELTGKAGAALSKDQLIQLILDGDRESALAALTLAEAEEDKQDISQTYRVG